MPFRRKEPDNPLRGIPANVVQSIRAFRAQELQHAAIGLGQHFLYANLAHAQTRPEALECIARQFTFPPHFGKNFDALFDCLTDPLYKCGVQPGFVVVLEHLPTTAKFDKEIREQLLDVFRDAADYWHERRVPFRCFYSFAVARGSSRQARAACEEAPKRGEPKADMTPKGNILPIEPMPTDKLTDISPLALRMSSPFNSGYWLAAVTIA